MNNSLNGLRHAILVQRTLLKLKYLNFQNKMVIIMLQNFTFYEVCNIMLANY